MSANNEVVIRRKQNGLYDIREIMADNNGEDDSLEGKTNTLIADDVDGLENAVEKANKYLEEQEDEGYPVEYGLRILTN